MDMDTRADLGSFLPSHAHDYFFRHRSGLAALSGKNVGRKIDPLSQMQTAGGGSG
jgi:hypothetical protein